MWLHVRYLVYLGNGRGIRYKIAPNMKHPTESSSVQLLRSKKKFTCAIYRKILSLYYINFVHSLSGLQKDE